MLMMAALHLSETVPVPWYYACSLSDKHSILRESPPYRGGGIWVSLFLGAVLSGAPGTVSQGKVVPGEGQD